MSLAKRDGMEPYQKYEIIARDLSGEISSEESSLLKEWISASPSNEQLYHSIKQAWQDTRTRLDISDVSHKEEIFARILEQANQATYQPYKPILPLKKSIWPGIFYKTAAVLTILAIAGLLVMQSIHKQESDSANEISMIHNSVNKGQKLKIHLPDGTIVWLNSESSLSYPDRFVDSVRMVELKGEAFFEVMKNPDVPFIVKSGDLTTTVIGTSFNFRSYDDQPANISLVSGKIFVNSMDHPEAIYLEPGERLNYFPNEKRFLKDRFNKKAETGWKDGIIYFEEAGFDEVVKTLERWYGVEIISKNKMKKPWKYTGEFENEYLDIVLESISYSKNFKYNIDQNTVYVEFY